MVRGFAGLQVTTSDKKKTMTDNVHQSCDIQDVSKGTDTFQSSIIKKLDNLRKFFSYH